MQGSLWVVNSAYPTSPYGLIVEQGKVGIGIAAPNYKLDVQGGQINSSGGLCIAGDCKTAWSQVASTNADTVDGYHVSVAGNANTLPTRNGSGYLIPENWTQLNSYYGLYSPNNGAHFYPNNGSYGSWRVAGSRNGWGGLEFDTAAGQTSFMVGTTGQGWGSQMTGFHNNSYGWLWRFDHSTLAVGNVPIARIPDIGSASVNYATSAGSAGSLSNSTTVNVYSCPQIAYTGGCYGWQNGCNGQLSTQATCNCCSGGVWTGCSCTYIGRMLLQ